MNRFKGPKPCSGRTPDWVKQYVQEEWGAFQELCVYNPEFDSVKNADTDSLRIEWTSPCYCNPPYNNWNLFSNVVLKCGKPNKLCQYFF